MIKTIIFDFDGTIVDSLPVALAGVNELADEYGYEEISLTPELRCNTTRSLMKMLGLGYLQLPKYSKKLRAVVEKRYGSVEPFAGISKVLTDLKKDYKLGLVSTNSLDNIQRILNKHNLKVFDFIHAKSTLFMKHRAIKKMIKKHKLKKDETIYIGDEIRDVRACRKSKIKLLGVTWGFNSREALEREGAEHVVDSPAELRKFLKNM